MSDGTYNETEQLARQRAARLRNQIDSATTGDLATARNILDKSLTWRDMTPALRGDVTDAANFIERGAIAYKAKVDSLESEVAQLRERLQVAESKLALAESTAACGNALASFVFGDEWPMVSAAVAGGMAALTEARR